MGWEREILSFSSSITAFLLSFRANQDHQPQIHWPDTLIDIMTWYKYIDTLMLSHWAQEGVHHPPLWKRVPQSQMTFSNNVCSDYTYHCTLHSMTATHCVGVSVLRPHPGRQDWWQWCCPRHLYWQVNWSPPPFLSIYHTYIYSETCPNRPPYNGDYISIKL